MQPDNNEAENQTNVGSTASDPRVHDSVLPAGGEEHFQQGGVREVPSEAFHVPVEEVLQGAINSQFASVVVIGLDHGGNLIVAGSHGTPMILDMIKRAPDEIDRLEDEDAEETPTA